MLALRKCSTLLCAAGAVAFALPFLSSVSEASAARITEEQQLLSIAKTLKPIPNLQWNEIAGAKAGETYELQNNDTLWTVSKRLFGNPFYWPKVWALNTSISNPHVVSPGMKLTFTPGSSETAPRLAPTTGTVTTPTAAATPENTTAVAKNTHDYDGLPLDRWAPAEVSREMLKSYDEYGIDKELKIQIPKKFAFRVPSIANDTKLSYLGEIVGSRTEGVGLSENQTVFLKSNTHDLQVGTSYSVLSEPKFASDKHSDRTGYIYSTTGEIKIVGVKDELYVGLITRAYDVIKRGDRVYTLLPLINEIKPIAGPTPVEGLVLLDKNARIGASQFNIIHLDRGIEDGVQIGHVFRLFDYFDPTTKDKVTDSDFLIRADAIVVHSTAQFSTALVLRSRSIVKKGDFGVLLTDVSDLEQLSSRNEPPSSADDKELDELDALDRATGEGLGRKEEQEIKELEHWDKTKDEAPKDNETVPSSPDASPEVPPVSTDQPLDSTMQPETSPSTNPEIPPTATGPEPTLEPVPETALEPVPEAAPEPAVPQEPTPVPEITAPPSPPAPNAEPVPTTPPAPVEPKAQ